MAIADALIGEFEREAATTRKLLERVPVDKLSWKPHKKSQSPAELARHIATIPGNVASLALANPAAFPESLELKPVSSVEQLLRAFDDSVTKAKEIVGGFDDASLMENWSATAGGKTVFAMPRIGLLRAIMLNHWYHHRGQLSVYRRLLDVPVPSIYGASADENPFG